MILKKQKSPLIVKRDPGARALLVCVLTCISHKDILPNPFLTSGPFDKHQYSQHSARYSVSLCRAFDH